MNKLPSALVYTAILLMLVSGVKADTTILGEYSKLKDKASKIGHIHGIFTYCGLSAPSDITSSKVYIPGTSFNAVPKLIELPDSQYGGEFAFSNMPVDSFAEELQITITIPTSESAYTITTRVYDGYLTDLEVFDICRDEDFDSYTEEHDCNDTNAAINPGAEEICFDEIDSNCNLFNNDGCPACDDIDGDGFYIARFVFGGAPDCPTPLDCNDRNTFISPNASEICDTLDNNCDGQIDEGFINTDLNCGACGVICTYPDTCVAGVCSNQ